MLKDQIEIGRSFTVISRRGKIMAIDPFTEHISIEWDDGSVGLITKEWLLDWCKIKDASS